MRHYHCQYAPYSFTNVRLIEFRRTLVNGCSNLTDLPCSLQMDINVYFFWLRFILIYYSSIVIIQIYICHDTVRLLSCFSALSLIIIIIFRTDLILVHYNKIFRITSVVCGGIIWLIPMISVCLSRNQADPLSLLCASHVSPNDLYEFLQNDTSKCARFYRWAKKMMKQWNIEEEKFIINIFITGIISIVAIIVLIYALPSDGFE